MPKPKDDTPIIELRNMGPACEEQLAAVGIHTAGDIREVGIKETFERMMLGRIQRGDRRKFINAGYLYALHGAIHDMDWRELTEKQKTEYKNFTANLRREFER